MKISIINDAAWVGYELSDALRKMNVDVMYLPRTRTLFGKTFGALINSLKATGLIHVNYALQDAYLTLKLRGRIDVLHTHGSDVRTALKTKKWGWMVRASLDKAEVVLVSTPDLLPLMKPIRGDAEYLPNPVDTDRFMPVGEQREEPMCLYITHNYESMPQDLVDALRRRNVPLHIVVKGSYSYFEMHKVYPKFSIFIDRFTIPSLSKSCLEAMSCGLSTIDHRHKEDLAERVESLLDPMYRVREGEVNRKYVVEHHGKMKVAAQILKIYEKISDIK